ncbi:DUF4038 domain-containing protein [Planctomycetota bacterium]
MERNTKKHPVLNNRPVLEYPNMNQTLLIVCLIVFPVCTSYSQTTLETSKWECIDLPLSLDETVEKPFQLKLSCEFTASDGYMITVPGFYNGQNKWVVRFNPNRTGTWKAVSQSPVHKLNSIHYTIEVAPAKPGNHGTVRRNPKNPQKLVYEDGTPYNTIAFECDWLFALDYGNLDLPKTKQLIEAVRSNGLNQIIMNVYAYDVSWEQDKDIDPKYQFGSKKEIFPYLGNNEEPDRSALNIDFFQHFDRVIDLLEANGIVSHLMIYVWNKQVNWPEANSAADNMYFDYVVKRYQAKNNILWDISKEALGYGHENIHYITERIARLRKLDAYDRLVTVHDYKYCSTYPEEVDMISAQLWSTDIYSIMLDLQKKYPDKPILNIEHGGYEKCQYHIFVGAYDDPVVCLERNYKCAFAGAYSCYYWQGTSWNVNIYSPFADEVTLRPKFEYYKYMKELLDKYKFEKLQPIEEKSPSGYCLANEEEGVYLYYVPKENSAFPIRRLPEAEKMQLTWFNPLTGQYSEQTEIDYRGWVELFPKFDSVDNVLIVKLIDGK